MNNNKEKSNDPKDRLLSLDALRGFDMLWIVGGGSLLTSLSATFNITWLKRLAEQMQHVAWEGFRFYDLIFPLFMFIVGIAIPLSVKSKLEKNIPLKNLIIKASKRMVVLIVLGMLYNGVFRDGFANARYASVLGQIGIAYFFTTIIVIYSKSFKTIIFWLVGILVGVSFLQLFIPVPGIGAGVLTPEGCINGYIDRMWLPGRLAYGGGTYDALGILSIVSAIGITLMGTVAGRIVQNVNFKEYRKIAILALVGIILIILALLLSPYYPIIKKCWTTTFNMLAGGISFLLFALFYLIIDVWGYHKWSFFFGVIGVNSIFIYLFVRIVHVQEVIGFFTGWIEKPMLEAGSIVNETASIIGVWLLVYYMYKKRIFIKV